jgi:hypothetical protein
VTATEVISSVDNLSKASPALLEQVRQIMDAGRGAK